MVHLKQHHIDLFQQNKALYDVLKTYGEGNALKDSLTNEEKYFLSEMLLDYKRNGLDLDEDKRSRVIQLEKELAQLVTDFEKNIYLQKQFIEVSRQELSGLSDDFIDALEKTHDGLIIVG